MEKERVDEMLKECAKMKDFNHPNVLTLKGVCLDGGPAPFIIMPFMANGSLLSYLKDNRKTLVLDPSTCRLDDIVSPKKECHKTSCLVLFYFDIGRGPKKTPGHLCASWERHGVSGQQEIHTQGPRCKELHVSPMIH